MTVDLGADFQIAHCARISFRPLAVHPRVFSRPPFSLTVATDLLPSRKNPPPRYTRLRIRLSKWRAQREVFERVAGEIPGGTVKLKLGSPLGSRLSSGPIATVHTVHEFHSGPVALHPRVFFPAAVFLHRHHQLAAQREKDLLPLHTWWLYRSAQCRRSHIPALKHDSTTPTPA